MPKTAIAAAALAFLIPGAPLPAAAATPGDLSPTASAQRPGDRSSTAIGWHTCPTLSDDVIRSRNVTNDRIPAFRALLNRLECGKIDVPLDYDEPRGRQISIAVTRLKAADQARRLGSLALNPGGPGGSGYYMPVELLMMNGDNARLNDRYDLIGFDTRGVGYSAKAPCPPASVPRPDPGPLTEEAAKRIFDAEHAANITCGQSDAAFLGRLTTLNVAHDLDRVREALGERKLHFLGISWGSWLGAVYRSAYPRRVERMFLDSVALPKFRLDDFEDGRAAAAERAFLRQAAWIAARHETYGLGTTARKVYTEVLNLRRALDETQRRYNDLPMALDGGLISMWAGRGSPEWPKIAAAYRALRDSANGDPAPAAVKDMLGRPRPPVPPDAPETFNLTTSQAVFCNEDPSRLGFADAWAAYQQRLEKNPVTGRFLRFSAACAGWPLPVQEYRARHGGGSLVLSGHRHESISPYEWTLQMRKAIGGKVFTVDDDMHGSATKEQNCAVEMVSFFTTGRIGRGCQGVATP
ncbi:TAP-like protein [Sinosporangium album]|uniref:TAP-like protein n=1 Tax=Sinosporangium album TaxID=504805 RepID=A0A1G8HTT5_9ACTN|nr:alpha/beta fold hydrolase [Sinosporangium album]SDI10068.1 TAP-like protein [Sinosporangium album]